MCVKYLQRHESQQSCNCTVTWPPWAPGGGPGHRNAHCYLLSWIMLLGMQGRIMCCPQFWGTVSLPAPLSELQFCLGEPGSPSFPDTARILFFFWHMLSNFRQAALSGSASPIQSQRPVVSVMKALLFLHRHGAQLLKYSQGIWAINDIVTSL